MIRALLCIVMTLLGWSGAAWAQAPGAKHVAMELVAETARPSIIVLRTVIADAALRARLAAAAQDRASRYTIDSSADQLAALMRSLLMQPQRRAS